mmetsp:Transcript_16578/g.28217  ORF Transcript_16578/g.28217 Transcript_16578/m.28217 type:complete len:162 (+) Transcript_16578:616-1101(+)
MFEGEVAELGLQKEGEAKPFSMEEDQEDSKEKIEIPLHMLTPENPVIVFDDVVLFEDELSDWGSSKTHVRFRVMKDCWFALLRSYLRVDQVGVRILDTQIFHKFGEKEITRVFQWRESSWQELQEEKGFVFDSEWLLSPYQSDSIYDVLELKYYKGEKIII